MLKRSSRAGVEDRWHHPPRRGEQVPFPADHSADLPGTGAFCMDPKHGTPDTQMMTVRHGKGKRWLTRWTDHDGETRSQSYDRKADAQRHRVEVTTALTTGTYADPKRGAVTFATVAEPWFDSKSGLKPKTRAGYR